MTGQQPDVHCPSCGAPAERGQLVCLECGARVALVYRRPPSWKVPVAITAVVALLLGGAAVVAVSALSDDADREVAAAPPRPQPKKAAPAETEPKPSEPKKQARTKDKQAGDGPAKKSAAERDAAPAAGGLARRGALYAWPRTLEGFTVVINSTEDRASATTFARSASKSRPAKLGVIRADDFKTLPKGFYVVFAGYYDSRGEADRATARLGRKYQGAFTQSVQR